MSMYNFMHNQNGIERAAGRREIKIVRLLEQLIGYCKFLKTFLQSGGETIADDADRHPLAAISCLMKVSFDEEYRHTMCNFDALQIISNLVYLDFAVHGSQPTDQCCYALRRYALMTLTNLTFGDENNKSILCRQKQFMNALVGQLETAPDDLLQVTASVLRNLSWRPDNNTKIVLNKIGAVTALVQAAMRNNQNENTLKAILSALWNLSAHCSTNKVELCAVNGALAFLVDMLTFEAPSKTLKIVENAGGILRNVSSHIAVCENYRQILRQRNCLGILLEHLNSDNMTLVSNSCGTLWNLSARCQADQHFLLEHDAIPLLRSLTHSKHAMISEGSAAALKNLLSFRMQQQQQQSNTNLADIQSKWSKPALEESNVKLPTTKQLTSKQETPTVSSSSATRSAIVADLQSIVLTASNSKESIFAIKSSSPTNLTKERSKSLDYLLIAHEQQKTQEIKISSINAVNTIERSSKKIKYRSSYQETDLDQLTDFSLRYIENHIEHDVESPLPIATVSVTTVVNNFKLPTTNCLTQTTTKEIRKTAGANEIVCIEDNVKCYQTEGTPYMISNAASVDDLTTNNNNKSDNISIALKSPNTMKIFKKPTIITTATVATTTTTISESTNTYGLYSMAENPINYCEEGTPNYFSRRESFNSLHELPHSTAETPTSSDKKFKLFKIEAEETELMCDDNVMPEKPIQPPENRLSACSAQETPLMFSRSSSIDSLHDDDLPPSDDLSSVQSDFSRLASGIISPSDIPDSPTLLMPPRSPSIKGLRKLEYTNATLTFSENLKICELNVADDKSKLKTQTHNSIFEDNLNTFQVENTPAQFSCATSLSNLSIVDDDTEQLKKTEIKSQPKTSQDNREDAAEEAVEEDEDEEEEETPGKDDAFLLASCINIGMNRSTHSTRLKDGDLEKRTKDEITEYYTEDTPAMFSNLGSNTNLSAISIASCNNETKDNVSFNTSEGSGADEANLLQQCIKEGMQMPKTADAANKVNVLNTKPPAYPSEEMPSCSNINQMLLRQQRSPKKCTKKKEKQKPNLCNESLSSLSTDSDDDEDTKFLSQAIAAGYNRSKSNNHKHQQQNPIHTSSMSTQAAKKRDDRKSTMKSRSRSNTCDKMTNNSSMDSSDSSDNQSKSLLELCIRTGMHKPNDQGDGNVKTTTTTKYRKN